MRTAIISLATGLLVTTTACGRDSSGDDGDASTATLPDACTLLSDSEVEQLTGEAPTTAQSAQSDGSLSICHWGDGNADFFSVTLQIGHDWDAQVDLAINRDDAEYREVTGVGDRAYAELEQFVQAEHDDVLVIAGPVEEDDIGSLESMTNTIINRLP